MNYDTREALLLLRDSEEAIFLESRKLALNNDIEAIESLLVSTLDKLDLDIEHIMFSNIDFGLLINRLKESV